jgi:hypothetical protein
MKETFAVHTITRVLTSLTALAIACAGLTVAPAAAAGPDSSLPYIESISYGGSGCPQGSAGQLINDDRTSFTMIFDQFIAKSGPGLSVTESQKSCQLNVDVHTPAGAGAVCLKTQHRGYVGIPLDKTATQSAIYSVAGEPVHSGSTTYEGPQSKDYLNVDDAPVAYAGDEPGTLPVNANLQVRLEGPSGQISQITMDAIDGKIVFEDCSPTVVVDGCDSGVTNHVFSDGSSFNSLIAQCAADNPTNHGQFASCVSHLTNAWKKDTLITGDQKGAIQSCTS